VGLIVPDGLTGTAGTNRKAVQKPGLQDFDFGEQSLVWLIQQMSLSNIQHSR
jgi:hypothetical protein